MTVRQLLKRVQALPARQRDRLVRQILALEDEPGTKPRRDRQARVAWPDVEARAKRLLGDRVLPNLVLLERTEKSF